MANNRKKTAKDTLSNPPPRVGTRKRTAKKLDDYVDASFSESEPPHLHSIPLPPNQNLSKRDNQTDRGRPSKSSKKSNRDHSDQEMHLSTGSSSNVNGPIFRQGQQTSQDTALWSFADRAYFPSAEESLPNRPRAMQVTGTTSESVIHHDHHLDSSEDEEEMTGDTPDNQLYLLQTLPSYGENSDTISDVFQQQQTLPGTSDSFHALQESRENHDHVNVHSQQLPVPSAVNLSRQQSIQNVDSRRENVQQRIGSSGSNGTSSGANFRHQRNQENCYTSEFVQQHHNRSGPLSLENFRQQSNINNDLRRPDFNRHFGNSGSIDSRQQSKSFGVRSEPYEQQHSRPGPSVAGVDSNFRNMQNSPGPSNLRRLAIVNAAEESISLHPESGKGKSLRLNNSQSQSQLQSPSSSDRNGNQSSRKSILNEMPNAAFQDYVKRNIEFLKFHLKDISAKLDDLLNSRPKPCICTIQRIEENEDQFQLPMDSFNHIENMENTLRDNFPRQQMILTLLRIGGMTLQKTVYSIMDKLFTYEIGTQYTWTGKSTKGVEKNKFGDLKNILSAISGAVLANNDITADDKTATKIQFQVSEWLRHCQQNLKK